MEVADQRHADTQLGQLLDDGRHSGGRFFVVDGDAHHLAPSARELRDLARGADGVSGVGVGHRLHHHGRGRAYEDAAHANGAGVAARVNLTHGATLKAAPPAVKFCRR